VSAHNANIFSGQISPDKISQISDFDSMSLRHDFVSCLDRPDAVW